MSERLHEACICRRMPNTQPACRGDDTLAEQGKSVRVSRQSGERLTTYVLDGCVFTDSELACDGLFLLEAVSKKWAVLVELKGAHHIDHAFKQLAFVRHERAEYREILDANAPEATQAWIEKAFIVSNGMMSKPKQEALERAYGIRVQAVLHAEATTPIPDLRRYL